MITNSQQYNSTLEQLAQKLGLVPQPTGEIIEVPVDWEAVMDFIRKGYQFLVGTYEDELGISKVLSEDEWVLVMKWVLRKRIQFVRQRVYGWREGQTIPVERTFRLPMPLYHLFYTFGKVESELGVTFVPSWPELPPEKLTPQLLQKYFVFVQRLKHYFSFSEGLPSDPDGAWSYLIAAVTPGEMPVLKAVTTEAKPSDILLATAVQCGRVLAQYPHYAVTFTQVISQTQMFVHIWASCMKGIGDQG